MKPASDWMELKLWESQAASLDVRIALPETVDRTKDESAVFEVLSVGHGYWEHGKYIESEVKVGDVVMLCGYGSVARTKLPSGDSIIVGRARDVAFIMESKDLERRD